MIHPYFTCRGNYDLYKEEMVIWNSLPDTPEKADAQRSYDNFINERLRKEKEMAKSATIKKRENAPDFVWGSFGYKLDDLKEYVNEKGYINFDILAGKEGGYYVKVNDYGIKKGSVTKSDTQGNVLEFDEMPF